MDRISLLYFVFAKKPTNISIVVINLSRVLDNPISVGGSKRSLLSKSGFGQTQSKTVLWKTFIVRSLFLLLTILCSVSVGWFFAGGKFIVEFPQTSVDFF